MDMTIVHEAKCPFCRKDVEGVRENSNAASILTFRCTCASKVTWQKFVGRCAKCGQKDVILTGVNKDDFASPDEKDIVRYLCRDCVR